MRRTTPWIFALVLGISATAAAAVNLTSAGGFLFDIQENLTGELLNGAFGASDAYDSMYKLQVNGTDYNAGGRASSTSLGGRQVETAEIVMGALRVRRLIYVPSAGGDYARYLDLVRNPGASATTATIRIYGGLGSDFSTIVTGSSSGDTAFSTADDWFATDDFSDGGGDPSLAHVLQGPDGAVSATAATLGPPDFPEWSFTVTVPAGGQVGILSFAVQASSRAASMTEARRLITLPADAALGLDAYLTDIVNFPAGGAPVVRFTHPPEIEEGAEALVDIMVEDREGDPTVTWSWDTDDDGVFGELPGASSYTIPMGTTDGDGEVRIGVEASDGTNTRQVYRSIPVLNVAPSFASAPSTMANVRREYTYTPTVDDPALAADPFRFLLVTRPTGMTVDAMTGAISWTPIVDQRGRTFDVTLRVEDQDGGEDQQMWRIDVAENTLPEAPTPVSPIDRAQVAADAPVTLVVANGIDPDGDSLAYFFRVSQESAFVSPDLLRSTEITEGADGMTEWTTAEPLTPGLWYWDVWVDDGIGESLHRYGQLIVGDVDVPGADAGGVVPGDGGVGFLDAGAPPPPPGGGCNTVASSRGNHAFWLVGLVGLFFVRRRRR